MSTQNVLSNPFVIMQTINLRLEDILSSGAYHHKLVFFRIRIAISSGFIFQECDAKCSDVGYS